MFLLRTHKGRRVAILISGKRPETHFRQTPESSCYNAKCLLARRDQEGMLLLQIEAGFTNASTTGNGPPGLGIPIRAYTTEYPVLPFFL
jgi:hypothetical protein